MLPKCFASLLLTILIAGSAHAGTYWLHPSATAASWAACQSATDPGCDSPFACYCTFAQANANLQPGDIAYVKAGSGWNPTITNFTALIAPARSGTSASARIEYENAPGEKPVITNAVTSGDRYGVQLNGKSFIRITGLTLVDWNRWIMIYNGAHQNEIRYTTAYNATIGGTSGITISGYNGSTYTTSSTHNYIHHGKYYNLHTTPCGESPGDLIKIGSTGSGDNDSNNNSIDYNEFFGAGHTCTENFTHYNTWRFNRGHNEGFITDPAHVTGTATGGSSTSLIDTTKDFSALGVMSGNLLYVRDLESANAWGNRQAIITSISTTTNANDTLNYVDTGIGSTPNFAGGGHRYDISCGYMADANPPGNGKYAHRVFHLDSHSGQRTEAHQDRQLFEGNRAGFSAVNPGNNGAEGLSLSAGYSIIRYNSFFGNAGSGMLLKNSVVSSYNKIYNNTFYKNGIFAGINHPVSPIVKCGIRSSSALSDYNHIKNNILYDNVTTFAGTFGTHNETSSNLETDPSFINPDISDPTSATLPNLNISSTSAAKGAASHLTTASEAGTNSQQLYVVDAGYFQDGTWGSDLARLDGSLQADWITIGDDLSNIVQIQAIDYSSNLITLKTSTSWASGAKIRLYKDSSGTMRLFGTEHDMGAYPLQPVLKWAPFYK